MTKVVGVGGEHALLHPQQVPVALGAVLNEGPAGMTAQLLIALVAAVQRVEEGRRVGHVDGHGHAQGPRGLEHRAVAGSSGSTKRPGGRGRRAELLVELQAPAAHLVGVHHLGHRAGGEVRRPPPPHPRWRSAKGKWRRRASAPVCSAWGLVPGAGFAAVGGAHWPG